MDEQNEGRFAVLDVPVEATADEVAKMLNACVGAVSISAIVPWAPGRHRVFLRRRGVSTTSRGNKDGMDETALAFVRANAAKTNEHISELLLASGIKRSVEWVRRRKRRRKGAPPEGETGAAGCDALNAAKKDRKCDLSLFV